MIPVQRAAFYAMGGVFTEILFTSLKSLYLHQDFMLHGNTQLWVVGIYAGGGFIFEGVHRRISVAWLRVVMYVALIYMLEYSAGWGLRSVLGECPWHYHEPGNVHGLVQLNYLPLWFVFATIADLGVYYSLHYHLVHRDLIW
jgi:hypothetical protein